MHEVSQTAEQLSYTLSHDYAIWIPLCPVIACFVLFLCQVCLPRKIRDNPHYQDFMKLISIFGIGVSAVIATYIFYHFWTNQLPLAANGTSQVASSLLFESKANNAWFSIGEHNVQIGILLDNMSATVTFMVTWVACLIQIFSWGYMKGEDHLVRYFCYHSLFVASMLGMVLSDNFLTFLISWELMGLCSYLLIGFFWRKRSANNAQKKAFLTTRIGDLGFFLGVFIILGIWFQSGHTMTFRFEDFANLINTLGINDMSFSEHIRTFRINATVEGIPMYLLTAAALLLFMGTVGKSAQFPLHIWLPDAMEGPTPVSALIHAATMVAAGVYLVARTYFVFDPLAAGYSPALIVVAFIGAFTAFMAATVGVTQYDIKRVLAYSTISQLGYMVLGLGVGAMGAGVFHLATHAYFKALLFLGSGAVIFGCHHVQDMRYMGGLVKYMPLTFGVFLAGTLALMGFPLTSGFWSKDMILEHAFGAAWPVAQGGGGHSEYWIVFGLGIAGAVLTCFYMTRQIYMVFFGKNRRELIPEEERHGHSIEEMTPHESPPVMTVPLIILAIFALAYGFVLMKADSRHISLFNSSLYAASSHGGEHAAMIITDEHPSLAQGGEILTAAAGHGETHDTVEHGSSHGGGHAEHPSWIRIPQGLALLAVVIGIAAGFWVFFREEGRKMKDSWKKKWPKFYDIVYNKWYCDEYIQVYIVEKLLILNMFLRAVDMYIIDGIVNGVASITVIITKITRWFDDGIVDGIVNGVAAVINGASRGIKYLQSGYVQNYYMLIVVSVLGYMIFQGRDTYFKLAEVFSKVWEQFWNF